MKNSKKLSTIEKFALKEKIMSNYKENNQKESSNYNELKKEIKILNEKINLIDSKEENCEENCLSKNINSTCKLKIFDLQLRLNNVIEENTDLAENLLLKSKENEKIKIKLAEKKEIIKNFKIEEKFNFEKYNKVNLDEKIEELNKKICQISDSKKKSDFLLENECEQKEFYRKELEKLQNYNKDLLEKNNGFQINFLVFK